MVTHFIRGPLQFTEFLKKKPELEKRFGQFTIEPEIVLYFDDEHDTRLSIDSRNVFWETRKAIDYQYKSKEIHKLKLNYNQIEQAFGLLKNMGKTEVLISNGIRYESFGVDFVFSYRKDTKIGDFFEISLTLPEKVASSEAYRYLQSICKDLKLQTWSKQSFRNIIQDSWQNEQKQNITHKSSLDRIISSIESLLGKGSKGIEDKTIHSILKMKSNDYSHLEDIFNQMNKNQLLGDDHQVSDWGQGASIVIPVYNSEDTILATLQSISKQKIHPNIKDKLEVIVIDDGSTDNTQKKVQEYSSWYQIRYIKQDNMGRSVARNLGLSVAKREVIIFIDSDVILDAYFVNDHIQRHSCIPNAFFISFKENITKEKAFELLAADQIPTPDVKKDFRFEKEVKPDWLRIHRHVQNIEVRKVKIIEETDFLKNFGQDTVKGVWDLPSMSITNAISIKKDHIVKVGGFSPEFRGWGMEDTYIGSKLIAQGNYLIPIISTGIYHIDHPPRSGSDEQKMKEFNRNVMTYLSLISSETFPWK